MRTHTRTRAHAHAPVQLFNGKLPAMWACLNPATDKLLGSWMLWFQRRYRQYKDWAEQGEPKVMWLSGLHIPETYIAALVQVRVRARSRGGGGGLCQRKVHGDR